MRTGSPFNAWFRGRHRAEFAWFAVSDSMPLLTVDATRAARTIVQGCVSGVPEVIVGWPARLAVIANGLFPSAVALGMRVANALLPGPGGAEGDSLHSGWQSRSPWAPSPLTRLTERAALEHNQLQHAR
jgi:hypothetical protein